MSRRHGIRARFRRRPDAAGRHEEQAYFVDVEPGELAGVFAAPRWLRDFGVMAWLLVGIARWSSRPVALLALTQHHRHPRRHGDDHRRRCAPLVRHACGRRIPRAAATVVVFLALLGLGSGSSCWCSRGIASQASSMQDNAPEGRRQDRERAPGRRGERGQGAERVKRRQLDGQRRVPRPPRGARRGHRALGLARRVPVVHRAQPVLPAQGRAEDPGAGRSATWASPAPSRGRSPVAPSARCRATSPA